MTKLVESTFFILPILPPPTPPYPAIPAIVALVESNVVG